MSEMQQRCPQCGRQLTMDETGRIGRCAHHQMWFPMVRGAEGEAGRRNAEDARAREQQKRDQEQQKRQQEAEQERQRRASITRKLMLIGIAVLVVIALIFVFVVQPSLSYNSANEKLTGGDYAGALSGYASLGDYKDAPDRAVLCEALLALENGDIQQAMEKLDVLITSGDAASLAMLRDAFLPIMADWQNYGIPPQGMLQLLARRGDIDVNNTLDYDQLSFEAHAALLDDGVLASMPDDVDGDGQAELVVLCNGFTLMAYDMTETGNVRITPDATNSARCLVAFGDAYRDVSVDSAIGCYQSAYSLQQNDLTSASLADASRERAELREADGDAQGALADAKLAVTVSGSADDFTFYYDMMLRSCKDEADHQAGIDRWDAFRLDEGALLQTFGMKQKSEQDAGVLRQMYASTLAAQRDPACVALFREARELGADIDAPLNDAIAQQKPGLIKAQLRGLAIEGSMNDPARQKEERSQLASETSMALRSWQNTGMPGSEALALIHYADEVGVTLTGIDRDAVYQAAEIDAAGAAQASCNVFVNWDGNDYPELLTVDAAGQVQYYVPGESLRCAASVDTGLASPTLQVFDCEQPLVLVTSGAQDAFTVLRYDGASLTPVLQEYGVFHYVLAGSRLTYDKLLGGSIERYAQYDYSIDSVDSQPVRTGIDWQEAYYPTPADAPAALLRCMEAYTYGIAPEQARLTAGTEYAAMGFSLAHMATLPTPDSATAIAVAAYDVKDDVTLCEVQYTASGRSVRVYAAMVQEDGLWKAAGTADAFTPAMTEWTDEPGVTLLALNQPTENRLADKKDVHNYRVLLPETSQVTLMWQAGTENKNRTAFAVTLYSGDDLTNPIMTYELTLMAGKQASNPLFLSPGVYYVVVQPKSYTDVPYTLTLQAEPDAYVETESNGSIAEANAIEPNQAYTGALKTAKDVDCYVVTLPEAGKLEVTLQADNEDKRSDRYTVAIADATTGTLLNAFTMPGNVKAAKSCTLYLAPGRYVIQITKGSYASAAAYQLTASYEPMVNIEQEMNPDAAHATHMGLNKAYTGSFGVEGDRDYFTFTLDTDCLIQPQMSFQPLESNSRTYILTIMEGTQVLHTVNIGGKESQKVIVPLALPAGTYTMELRNPNFVTQPYSLTLAAMPVDAAENEPNDALANATPLALHAPVTGVISHEEDADMYKLVFAQDTTVTLSFAFPASTVSGTVYNVRLEQNGKSLWNTNVKGSTGGFEQQMQIPAGEYYIRVKPSTWISAVYTIELK